MEALSEGPKTAWQVTVSISGEESSLDEAYKRCLAVKEGGRVVCSKFLELTEPSECRYYEPIKGAA